MGCELKSKYHALPIYFQLHSCESYLPSLEPVPNSINMFLIQKIDSPSSLSDKLTTENNETDMRNPNMIRENLEGCHNKTKARYAFNTNETYMLTHTVLKYKTQPSLRTGYRN